ncbi:hypothetical protein HW555_005615 [Spodoptera exigua]|uniref:Uncharacterized protein n=1 Tax=Spodoptera exigua TaxID=7107 RepID=A0A835GHJ1_SPOEX|nr:hypothetical protein HW555_005615 [Spodoptera exigua]
MIRYCRRTSSSNRDGDRRECCGGRGGGSPGWGARGRASFTSLCDALDHGHLITEIELLADDAETAFVEREEFDRQFFNLVALTRSLLGSSVNGAGSEAGFKDADSGAHESRLVGICGNIRRASRIARMISRMEKLPRTQLSEH